MCSISRTLLFVVFLYFHLPVSPMRVQSEILSNRLRPRRPWQTCECLQVQKHAHHFPCMLGFQKRGSKASDVLVRGSLTNYRHPCRQIEQFLRESGTSSRLETPNFSSVSRRRSSRRRLGPATKDGFVFLPRQRVFFMGRDSFFLIKIV